MCLLLLHVLLELYDWDDIVMSWDDCSYYEIFLTCGRLSWLCNIYIGLALRDAFGSFSIFQFMV